MHVRKTASSAQHFDGWADAEVEHRPPGLLAPVEAPSTWLLEKGWCAHHPRIGANEAPAG